MLKNNYEIAQETKKLEITNPNYNQLKIKPIELLTDETMRLFFKQGRRGGISQASIRYLKKEEGEDILYIDANNLYGWKMSEPLPHSNYEWLDDNLIEEWNKYLNSEMCYIKNYGKFDNEKNIGYFLEIDIHLPNELHDLFNYYPLFPELKKVTFNELSNWQQSFNQSQGSEKLLLTLHPKEHYIVHIRYLQFAINHGYICTRIHSIIKFIQYPFIKDYIEKNTKIRNLAKTEFEKDQPKLANNIIYGKTNQDKDKQFEWKLFTDSYQMKKYIFNPRYKGEFQIYDPNLVGIKLHKLEYTFNKPIQVACAILDFSKLLMAQFLYDCLLPFYNNDINKVKLAYTDTDSFIFKIINNNPNSNVYKEFILPNKEWFDLSAYPFNHIIWDGMLNDEKKLLMKNNEKVIGKFKDEMRKYYLQSGIFLRAKCYALRKNEGDDKAKCKGVIETPSYDNYYDALFNKYIHYTKQITIGAENHNIYIKELNKRVFDSYDDKRYIQKDNSLDTFAFGHYKIKK